MNVKTGIGYDVHPFRKNRRLIIGGIEIPYKKGLAGHSDADVLLHAICDALLGAAGEGDMGRHFPDTDPRYRNISSLKLLEEVVSRVVSNKYRLVHIDTVLIAQEPYLTPFIPQMCAAISKCLGLPEKAVNIKAKSNEKLGFIGRGEGIAAQAIATLIGDPEEANLE
jgi:2-C-methyl-D-erythritol 2,4-cyclodiphosphate synthase